MNSRDPDGRDPTLAAERTDLAWSRSGLSLLALGAAILRGISRTPLNRGDIAVGVTLLVLGVVVAALGAWREQRVRRSGPSPANLADLAPITAVVTAVGLVAFITVLLS